MKLLFYLAVWTGLRLADCAMMKWESIDLERERIYCVPQKTAHKTGKSVTIPIHPSPLRELKDAENLKGCNDYLLPEVAKRYKNNPSGVRKDTIKFFKFNSFETTGENSSVQRKLNPNIYGFHSFRHSFLSFCAQAGVPLPVVESIVGHGNPAVTRHYVHIGKESLRQAIINLFIN